MPDYMDDPEVKKQVRITCQAVHAACSVWLEAVKKMPDKKDLAATKVHELVDTFTRTSDGSLLLMKIIELGTAQLIA